MGTIHLSLFVLLCLGVSGLSSEILQRQKRNWIIASFTIDEGYEGPFPYYLDKISVEKTLTLFKISGQGFNEEPKDTLEINSYTGEITVKRPVDYEQFNELKLVFQALDKESHVIDTQLGIEIKIMDSNDNPPKFDQEQYEITIEESTSQGTHVITIKATDADSGNNKMFDLRIISVTPEPEELEFYLNQIDGDQIGTISFKGCLDHEKTEKYTIIVEAKDRGKKKQLSSSCTVIVNIGDGNNHFPVITRQTGPGSVKEGQKNVLVSRLQTTDADTKGTAAWRVKYQIQGDTHKYFSITTDPETNDGLLYVEKQLDYEDSSQRNVTISVQNEIPFYSCKVERRTTTGLWIITSSTVTISGAGVGIGTGLLGSSTYQVTVTVEDVNEPPIFDEPNKGVQLLENVNVGHYLVAFTARDPDVTSVNTFVYIKGEDPADWVTVDPTTGKITTSKIIDRESVFVKDNIYVVTIFAVDNGEPPMTSTATLTIHVRDSNDNAPFLTATTINICQSANDVPSKTNITAMDLDEVPYGGPFSFKLKGNVEGMWKIDPVQGYSVNLVKDGTVYSGHYELLLEVSDLQGNTAVHNLSVAVCNCLDTSRPNCHLSKSTGSTVGGRLLIPSFILLVIAGMLLLISLVSCEKQQIKIPDDDPQQHMISFNIERPGTDCKVAFGPSNQRNSEIGQRIKKNQAAANTEVQKVTSPIANVSVGYASSGYGMSQTEMLQRRNNLHWLIADSLSEESQVRLHYSQSHRKSTEQNSSWKKSMRWGASSATRMRHLHGRSKHASSAQHSKHSDQEINVIQRKFQQQVLKKMLYTLQAPGKELGDYAPHVYAEEGEAENSFELDAISISEISFDPDLDWDMDFKFRTLASMCMPGDSTAYSTKSSSVIEKLQTATLIQVESHKTKMNTQSHL